jgi:hypothetical protein
MTELKCNDCDAIFPEDDMGEEDVCPSCGGDSLFERDPGYHTNDFGELIAHAITITPLAVKGIKL